MSKKNSYSLYIIDDIDSEAITVIVSSLHKGLSEHHGEDYHLEVNNVFENGNAEKAVNDGVFSIPALVKKAPEPQKHALGDMSDTRRILLSLLDDE